ncbi:unnamed protein product [Arctia plantaginis]|uniref:Uncharacterized protein n=1 Tax=Arctia plantaginis TaxID=874455 RepID=A0A8S1ANM4_ARCPL|nr:unnamed protein product [Arctia plantaginis]
MCEFGGNLEENLRDQLVCGLKSDVIRQRLFAEDSLAYSGAVKLTCGLEAAECDAAVVEQKAIEKASVTLNTWRAKRARKCKQIGHLRCVCHRPEVNRGRGSKRGINHIKATTREQPSARSEDSSSDELEEGLRQLCLSSYTPVQYKNKAKYSELFVIDGGTTSLLDWQWLTELEIKVPSFQQEISNHSHVIHKVPDTANCLINRYKELFSSG